MEQTAVEFLYDAIDNELIDFLENRIDIHELSVAMLEAKYKAKEMEKEQIIEARQDGYDCTYAEYGETPKCYLEGSNEQYYNETYNVS